MAQTGRMRRLLPLPVHAVLLLMVCMAQSHAKRPAGQEAPTGFDEHTNGYLSQTDYQAGLIEFNDVKTVNDGLGPVFNEVSCQKCHKGPANGGTSHFKVTRAGYLIGGNFIPPAGGSMIAARATRPEIRPVVPADANVITQRTSLSTLGDGYIEAILDADIIAGAKAQPGRSKGQIHGQYVMTDLLEAPGAQVVGRFGWKAQHASLVSFAADAYRNEMGITSPLDPTEPTSNGRSVEAYERASIPNDQTNNDVYLLADFMRSTKAPPRRPARGKGEALGAHQFESVGCSICHTQSFTTAPPGTVILNGTFTVPEALGSRVIHPFSDFLLHDVATGDGIVQNGDQTTRNKVRTMNLWGLATRKMFLHDGSASSIEEAIHRHGGEAAGVMRRYNGLKPKSRRELLEFLHSL